MLTVAEKIRPIGKALAEKCEKTYHYWRSVDRKIERYIIWQENGGDNFAADDHMAEQAITGTVDLFTKTEYDPTVDAVQSVLDENCTSWVYSSVQYEEETNLIHHEWTWAVR